MTLPAPPDLDLAGGDGRDRSGSGWLGRWAEALTEYRKVAEARERTLGAGHPDTLAGRNDEAHCLEQLGRRAEAADLYRRVADLRRTGGPH